MPSVDVNISDNIAIVTLNRPEALNALNTQVLKELDETITELEANENVYVVVITGAGRAFVAGADIGEMQSLSAEGGQKFGSYGNSVFMKIENMSKPVIAAVNGFALGGGCELAMACDIRLAGEKAKFGQPEVGLGITPGFGGTQRLPRIVGISMAMELVLTAKTINAETAKEIGLVNAVYPQDQLIGEAMKIAREIASKAQIAVRQAKKCMRHGRQTDMHTALAYESEAFGLCFSTEDQKDAMSAFIEKRKLDGFKNK